MSELNPPPGENKPWWNDGDKMGGLIATILFLIVLALLAGLVVKFLFWLF